MEGIVGRFREATDLNCQQVGQAQQYWQGPGRVRCSKVTEPQGTSCCQV